MLAVQFSRTTSICNVSILPFTGGQHRHERLWLRRHPLIAACRNGHTKIVQLLLKFGADVTLRNYECETAVSVSSAAIRKMLLESVERSGCSHRHLLQAAWQGNISVVQQLLVSERWLSPSQLLWQPVENDILPGLNQSTRHIEKLTSSLTNEAALNVKFP